MVTDHLLMLLDLCTKEVGGFEEMVVILEWLNYFRTFPFDCDDHRLSLEQFRLLITEELVSWFIKGQDL